MDTPHGIVVDNDRYIFVADTGNNRIFVVNPSLTDLILTVHLYRRFFSAVIGLQN